MFDTVSSVRFNEAPAQGRGIRRTLNDGGTGSVGQLASMRPLHKGRGILEAGNIRRVETLLTQLQ